MPGGRGVVRRPIPSRFGCGLGSQCLVLCQTDSAGCSFSEAQHLHVLSRLGRRLRGDDSLVMARSQYRGTRVVTW